MSEAKPKLATVGLMAAIRGLWRVVALSVLGTTVITYVLVRVFFTVVDPRAILIGVICSVVGSASIGYRNLRFWTTIREDNARLEEQNRELDAYARSVAHELRGPLTAILGFSGLLSDAEFDETEIPAVASHIHRAALGMNDSVDALLALARLRKPSEFQPVDVGAAVKAAWQRVTPADIEATLVTPASWPTVKADKKWLEQALVNYLGNAVKYGGRPLQVTVDWEPRGGMIRTWVEDNGPGFPGDPSHLFEEFHRSNDRVDGHGLGLWIVDRLAAGMGGAVGAENGDHGARFWLDLSPA